MLLKVKLAKSTEGNFDKGLSDDQSANQNPGNLVSCEEEKWESRNDKGKSAEKSQIKMRLDSSTAKCQYLIHI